MKPSILILIIACCIGCNKNKKPSGNNVTGIEPRSYTFQYVTDNGDNYTLSTSVIFEWGEKSNNFYFNNNTLYVYGGDIIGSFKYIKSNKLLEYKKYDSMRLHGKRINYLIDSILYIQTKARLRADSLKELNK